MKIASLLKHHQDAESKSSLNENLGDGYLLKNNRVFSGIRNLALASGFSFDMGFNSLYAALPLSQLDSLMRQQRIPFTDNVSVLRSLETQIPGQVTWDHVCDGLKKNRIFHESSHAVARSIRAKIDFSETQKKELKILQILIEESFANCCELLGIVDVKDSVHRIFYECNSYFTVFDDKTNLAKALEDYEAEGLIGFLICAYVHSNFLNNEMSDADFKKLVALNFPHMSPDRKSPDTKRLKSLAKNCYLLNPRFRSVTTSLYLRLNGISIDAAAATGFDWIATIEKSQPHRDYVRQLAGMLSDITSS
jgi:hypothetical protein